jgi:hypothetical protein
MIQSVDATSVTPEIRAAESLLGYIAGNSFLDYNDFVKARPDLAAKGWIVSTTLTCNARARCYDIEPGGGQNKNIGIFMRNADRSHGLPWLYTFLSNAVAMVNAAKAQGYHMGTDYHTYIAHPNTKHGMHVCGPTTCGELPFQAGGTQYLFARTYDRGLLNDYMLPAVHHAADDPEGVWRFEGAVYMDGNHGKPKGTWEVEGKPGQDVKMGGHDRKWAANLTVTEQHGQWDIQGTKFE